VLWLILVTATGAGEPCDALCAQEQQRQQAATEVSSVRERLFSLRQKGPRVDVVDAEIKTRGAECEKSLGDKRKAATQAHNAAQPGPEFDAKIRQEQEQGPRKVQELNVRAVQMRNNGPDLTGLDNQIRQAEADTNNRLAELKQQLAAARAAHSKLIDERGRSLEELDLGLFCSRCFNTATQLGGMEKFRAHLHDVNAVAVPAPADKRAAKVDEYRKLISAAYDRVRSLEDQVAKADAARSRVDQLRAQKNNAWPAHNKAIAETEAAARQEDQRWRAAVQELEKQRRDAQDKRARAITDGDAAVRNEEKRCDDQRRELAAKREQTQKAYDAEVAQLTSSVSTAEKRLSDSVWAVETTKARAKLDGEMQRIRADIQAVLEKPPPPSGWRVVQPGPMDDPAQLPFAEEIPTRSAPSAAPIAAPPPTTPPPAALEEVKAAAPAQIAALAAPPPVMQTRSLGLAPLERAVSSIVKPTAEKLVRLVSEPSMTRLVDAGKEVGSEVARRIARNVEVVAREGRGGPFDVDVKGAPKRAVTELLTEVVVVPLVRMAIDASKLAEAKKLELLAYFHLIRGEPGEVVNEALRYGVRGTGFADPESEQ
jgi:hypothetical protein